MTPTPFCEKQYQKVCLEQILKIKHHIQVSIKQGESFSNSIRIPTSRKYKLSLYPEEILHIIAKNLQYYELNTIVLS